ncbi:hypothetical protein ACHAXS_012473 [Conticribra weissflogii]
MVRRRETKLRDDRTPSTYTDELSYSTGSKSSVESSIVSSSFATGGVLNNLDTSPLLCCIGNFDYELDENHSIVEKRQKKKVTGERNFKFRHTVEEKAQQAPLWDSFTNSAKFCIMGNGLENIQYIYCTAQDDLVSEVTIPMNLVNIAATQNLRISDPSAPGDSTFHSESHEVSEIPIAPSTKTTISTYSTPSLKLSKVPSLKRSGSFFRRKSSRLRASPIPHENGLIEI